MKEQVDTVRLRGSYSSSFHCIQSSDHLYIEVYKRLVQPTSVRGTNEEIKYIKKLRDAV